MKQHLLIYTLSLLLIGILQATAFAQINDEGRWKNDFYYEPVQIIYSSYSEADLVNAETKLEAIKLENSSLTDEWAGDYSALGSEVNRIAFRWSPQNGFVLLNFYTCLPELRSLQFGTVTATPDYILLNSQNSQRKEKPMKLLPVKWGERHYLIPESEVAQFYKFVAGYGWKENEYVFFDYLMRAGDAEKPISGMPIFPRGHERFVRKPIDATITKIIRQEIKTKQNDNGSEDFESHVFVRLNAGSINNLKRGMTLNVLDFDDNETIKVTQVGKNFSSGVIVRSLDEDKQETYKNYQTGEIKSYPKVSSGWTLSTRSLLLINN